MKTESRIYVGTYAKYNDGNLFGKWVDLSDFSDKDEFIEACLELHNDEDDPELMFQDWENIPDCYISESWIDEGFWDVLNSDVDFDAFTAFIEMRGSGDISEFEDAFMGEYDNEEDFAEQLLDDLYLHEVPDFLRNYIDYNSFARDVFCGDYYFNNGYVFRSI
jgi:antirestriction protein